jgi:hypothetical protein
MGPPNGGIRVLGTTVVRRRAQQTSILNRAAVVSGTGPTEEESQGDSGIMRRSGMAYVPSSTPTALEGLAHELALVESDQGSQVEKLGI